MKKSQENETLGTPPEPAGSQLAFDLDHGSSSSREDLVVGKTNRLAIDLIDSWPAWDSNLVLLAGPVGSGKSHIASVWAKSANAKTCNMQNLGDPASFQESNSPLLIEDAGNGLIDEERLFHILNIHRATNRNVLITSRLWPSSWGIELPDLNSRLRAAQLVEMGEPDDDLLKQVLVKLFADRQLPVEANVIDYLVVRMERSLGIATQLVNALDKASLQRKNKITRHLAADVMGW